MADVVETFIVAMDTAIITWRAWRCGWIELCYGRRGAHDEQSGCNDKGFHATLFPK
jgi:hypothetical protein